MHVFRFRKFGLKNAHLRPKIGVFKGENRERSGAILTPNELVLTFGGLHVCVQFGENRRRESVHRLTDTRTHTRTDRRKTILLSVPCYML